MIMRSFSCPAALESSVTYNKKVQGAAVQQVDKNDLGVQWPP